MNAHRIITNSLPTETRIQFQFKSAYVKETGGGCRDTTAAGCTPQMLVRTGKANRQHPPPPQSFRGTGFQLRAVNPGLMGRLSPT